MDTQKHDTKFTHIYSNGLEFAYRYYKRRLKIYREIPSNKIENSLINTLKQGRKFPDRYLKMIQISLSLTDTLKNKKILIDTLID